MSSRLHFQDDKPNYDEIMMQALVTITVTLGAVYLTYTLIIKPIAILFQ